MIRFREKMHPMTLSYIAVQSEPQLEDMKLEKEIERLEEKNTSLKVFNKFLLFAAAVDTVIVTIYVIIPGFMEWLAM